MKTIINKTQKPLSIPLPRGKILHLGPGKVGQIASSAADHPQVKKLIEGGQIEVLSEGPGSNEGAGGGKAGRTWMPGHSSSSGRHRSGDR